MRHGMAHRKFNCTTNQRKALLSGLAIHLIERERIHTTLPKAKEIRPIVERLITKGKRSEYRNIHRFLRNEEMTKKVISAIAPRFADRPGGYLRIIKTGFRHGDNAPMAMIEFIDYQPIL